MPPELAPQKGTSAGLKAYWSIPANDLLAGLRTQRPGLTSAEAATRLKEAGPNTIGKKHGASAIAAFARQFRSPLVLILIFAASVSASVARQRASEPVPQYRRLARPRTRRPSRTTGTITTGMPTTRPSVMNGASVNR